VQRRKIMIGGLTVTAALALVAALMVPAPASAIIGGSESSAAYPFMGSLNRPSDSPRPDGHVCGVTLIAPQWAVTASHCTRNDPENTVGYPHDWTVRLGSISKTSGGEQIAVQKYVRRSNGTLSSIFGKDIALLKLATPAKATPIPIAKATPAPGTYARILGWGMTCNMDAPECYPEKLREADTEVQKAKACVVSGSDICVGSPDGKIGPANLDSGGPALIKNGSNWVLAGVVSGGDSNTAGIYTNAAVFRRWIEASIAERKPTTAGAVALETCSGSVVRGPKAKAKDAALLLTNGHCVGRNLPKAGSAITNRAAKMKVRVLGDRGETMATAHTKKLIYATMTGTDVALYRLDKSYARLEAEGAKVFDLATKNAKPGQQVDMLSGTHKQTWSCSVANVVPKLREGGYTLRSSIQYSEDCRPNPGDSGSPMIDPATGELIGVHNTSNGLGGVCTDGNPCEVDAYGITTVHIGRSYGQQTAMIPACLTTGSRIDLTQKNCELTKPKRERHQGPDGRRVGSHNRLWPGRVFSPQRGHDRGGFGLVNPKHPHRPDPGGVIDKGARRALARRS
jgi:Trypsin/Trypsin-like peptidase domain